MQNIFNKINSYSEFENNISLLKTTKEKGDLFEELSFFILKFHPNYQMFTKNVWLYKDIPYELKKELNLPDKDLGIDLILESVDNKYFAIQSKYRTDRNNVISWKELATFFGLSFGINNCFEGGFFITNTFEVHNNVHKSIKITPIYNDFFDELNIVFFKNIHEFYGEKCELGFMQKINPRLYQTTIINDCVSYFKNTDRGYLNMICGSGKTLTSYWIDKEIKNNLTLILVPSLYLLSQFYKDWQSMEIYNYILVGSDMDIDSINYKNNGVILTTDAQIIKSKIKNKTIIISTYQSSNKVCAALKDIIVDLCIFDEAHKTVSQLEKQFSLCLTNSNINIKKRLFMTATPKIYNGDVEKLDENILSMNNCKYYGNCIATYSANDAIKDAYLCDYEIMTINTDNDYIKTCIKENKLVYDAKIEVDAAYLAAAILIINCFKNKLFHHMVTYHNTIKNSLLFKNILENIIEDQKLDLKIVQIDGNHNMSNRNKIIKEFINEKNVIMTSAKVLNEGINIPIIDSICFIDNKQSTSEIIQCVGRALRLHEKKIKALILVPILCNSNNINNLTTYGNLMRVIKSLLQVDSALMDIFNTKNNNFISQKFKLFNYINNVYISQKIDINTWNSSIGANILEKIDQFSYWKNKLFDFCEKNNRIPTIKENIKLRNWIDQYKNTKNIDPVLYEQLVCNNIVKIYLEPILKIPKIINNLYVCNMCNKNFTLKYELYHHIKNNICSQENKVFECNNCNKMLSTEVGYLYHINNNVCKKINNDFKCIYCKKKFKERKGLEYHVKNKVCKNKIVKEVGIYTCAICQKSYISEAHFKNHQEKCIPVIETETDIKYNTLINEINKLKNENKKVAKNYKKLKQKITSKKVNQKNILANINNTNNINSGNTIYNGCNVLVKFDIENINNLASQNLY